MNYTIHTGDNRDILKTLDDNSVDAVVTDPPYGINFLGKNWDADTGSLETYTECLRVLKPGGYILAFSAARTYHHLAITLERSGFEIRDQLMWLYASGFPKAQDIGKAIDKRMGKEHKSHTVEDSVPRTPTRFMKSMACRVCGTTSKSSHTSGFYCGHNQEVELEHTEAQQWAGWKTALKPAHEPIVMARKPFKGSCLDNVLKHGTGALNIDAARIATDELKPAKIGRDPRHNLKSNGVKSDIAYTESEWTPNEQGRYPSNVIGEVDEDIQKYFINPKDDHEPIVMARKPFKGSCVDNVLKHGVGALNIDATRIPFIDEADMKSAEFGRDKNNNFKYMNTPEQQGYNRENMEVVQANPDGRFPSNVLGEIPDYQKYFYSPKVSRAERHIGFEKKPEPYDRRKEGLEFAGIQGLQKLAGKKNKRPDSLDHIPTNSGGIYDIDNGNYIGSKRQQENATGNNHPTVKPVALMRYLIKLVTPAGGIVLDPFNGSGSTGMAAVELGHTYIGCELDPAYVEIATRRIEAWQEFTKPTSNFEDLFDCP